MRARKRRIVKAGILKFLFSPMAGKKEELYFAECLKLPVFLVGIVQGLRESVVS